MKRLFIFKILGELPFFMLDQVNVTALVILREKDIKIEKKYGPWVVYQTKVWVNQCLLKLFLQLFFPSIFDMLGSYWFEMHAEHIGQDIKSL